MAIPSLMQRSFTDSYDEFLFACSHGDYLTVERLLQDGTISQDDISTIANEQKFSPIVIAIEHNHLEVIKILLDHLPYRDFREALLLAIYLDLTKIAQLIMEHDTFKCFYGTYADWQTDTVDTYDESHFAAIRPIQLAAQYNRTTILYNFLKHGERIEVPHKIECNCNECKSAGLTDSLRYSQLRLSTYRGLSSDVYLALVSEDPISSAFDLCNDLSNLIKNEAIFRTEYLILFNQVSNFTARLLDHIQNQIELELLLTIERLNSAIEHDQQDFITHTTTQQHLTNLWYKNIHKSDTLKNQFLASFYYFLIYIPMYIGYFWLPFYFENQCQWYFQQPAIQAYLHSITYEIFLLILILSGIIKSSEISLKEDYPQIYNYSTRLLTFDEERIYCQRNLMTYLKIFVLVFMMGYVYQNIRRIIEERRVIKAMEMVMTLLFILYIILFTTAAIQVHLEWKSILNIDKWKRFERLHNESQSSNEYKQLKTDFENNFILFGRYQSPALVNIEMIADGILSVTIVCCIAYLCFYFLISEYFGPLLVSLTTMSKTIYRWFVFISIFIFAYQTSFLHLFAYYSHDKPYGSKTDHYANTTVNIINRATISRSFGEVKMVSINVAFSFFGIAQNELTHTRKDTFENYTRNPGYHIHYYSLNSFTYTIGSFLYGTFAFCARIILITMIIAYIKRLYNANKEQSLNDWKFARAKVYMRFINKHPDVLPVPLNLIPTPRHIMIFFCRKKPPIQKLFRKNRPEEIKYLRNLNYLSKEFNSNQKAISDDVLNCIVLRFITKCHPFDIHSLKRQRQIQYKEELSEIRHYTLNEIRSIQQANSLLNQHISTVYFGLN